MAYSEEVDSFWNTPFAVMVMLLDYYIIVNFLSCIIYEPLGISIVVPETLTSTVFTILPLVSNTSTVISLSA